MLDILFSWEFEFYSEGCIQVQLRGEPLAALIDKPFDQFCLLTGQYGVDLFISQRNATDLSVQMEATAF